MLVIEFQLFEYLSDCGVAGNHVGKFVCNVEESAAELMEAVTLQLTLREGACPGDNTPPDSP